MSEIAYALIAENALPKDAKRLRAAYDEVRTLLGSRVGRDDDFDRRLAFLIIMVGGKRPGATVSELVHLVHRTYQAPRDQE